ncbi:hypothetical protein B0T21DRAFT_455251 [Apiosordaria backusii]|uniref:Uncharacterized protein n=1 Tax=Apiosordaria backusii TaxID=314023 RepID=A0AA40DKP2_9PEZI|nr:hypothetical protein B0T21DRAFT_455251 [Apiosordaria backusii]
MRLLPVTVTKGLKPGEKYSDDMPVGSWASGYMSRGPLREIPLLGDPPTRGHRYLDEEDQPVDEEDQPVDEDNETVIIRRSSMPVMGTFAPPRRVYTSAPVLDDFVEDLHWDDENHDEVDWDLQGVGDEDGDDHGEENGNYHEEEDRDYYYQEEDGDYYQEEHGDYYQEEHGNYYEEENSNYHKEAGEDYHEGQRQDQDQNDAEREDGHGDDRRRGYA